MRLQKIVCKALMTAGGTLMDIFCVVYEMWPLWLFLIILCGVSAGDSNSCTSGVSDECCTSSDGWGYDGRWEDY